MTIPARIDATLATLTPAEVRDALWMIGVFERWDMPQEEADEWRRRILARHRVFALDSAPHNSCRRGMRSLLNPVNQSDYDS